MPVQSAKRSANAERCLSRRKINGEHYTPERLAEFLARRICLQIEEGNGLLHVLDPACGDGRLLVALAEALPAQRREATAFVGYEINERAAAAAVARLQGLGLSRVDVRCADFLTAAPPTLGSLFDPTARERYEAVITNPPYVRTQVLGARQAQLLASRFGLAGRVDLYQAFVAAVTDALVPGGVLGLLTSNRFLMTQSGASMRRLLRASYTTREVFDFGDTRLFEAAVLPAVLVATRSDGREVAHASYNRAYEIRDGGVPRREAFEISNERIDLFDAMAGPSNRVVEVSGLRFEVAVGRLSMPSDVKGPWASLSDSSRAWLAAVEARRGMTFDDAAKVRVGIKTTADAVFIRDDWETLPADLQPEAELLRPLVTHHVHASWRFANANDLRRRVLYPHRETSRRQKHAVDLAEFPKARRYLESHRERLESRTYVTDAGRNWWELWVPQSPADWALPRLVYPDISEHPRFFLDESGAVVNGDCYWITPRAGVSPDVLYLMLGVANSRFLTRYYDARFHNKLYAGRRRFMTQYVREFPLPPMDAPASSSIVSIVKERCGNGSAAVVAGDGLDALVAESFGVDV